MDIFQAAIIYLACGIPFGARYFLARAADPRRYLYSAAVTLFWIAYLPQLFHNIVTWKLHRSRNTERAKIVPIVSGRLRDCARVLESAAARADLGIYDVRNAVERFAGISEILCSPERAEFPRFEALSAIEGHPDPRMSSLLIARRNRAVLERHHGQATDELLQLHSRLSPPGERDPEVDAAFSQLFELCGNVPASRRVMRASESEAKFGRPANRPRALRPIWKSTEPERASGQKTLTANDLAMRSPLQRED